MQVGPIGVFHEAANYDWSYEDIVEEGDQRFASTGGWLGFSDKYWLTALVPPQSADISAAFRRGANGGFQANYTVEPTIVAPGKAITHEARLDRKSTRLNSCHYCASRMQHYARKQKP